VQIEIINQSGEKQKVEAKDAQFSVVSENWNEYQLEDGRTLRIKLVLTRVLVPIDASVKNPDGTDVVMSQWQAIPICVGEVK